MGIRTPGLVIANDALYQLSYTPVPICGRYVNRVVTLFKTMGCSPRPITCPRISRRQRARCNGRASVTIRFIDSSLLDVVNLYETDAGRTVFAADNGGVRPRLQVRDDDRGFAGIAWLQSSRFNLRFLR
jgi:hypothetical protein